MLSDEGRGRAEGGVEYAGHYRDDKQLIINFICKI
jgi:hypothetical protein